MPGGERRHDRAHRHEAGEHAAEDAPRHDREHVAPVRPGRHELRDVPPGEQARGGADDAEPPDGALPADPVADPAEQRVHEDVRGVDADGHEQPPLLPPPALVGDHGGQDDEHAELGCGVDQPDGEPHQDPRSCREESDAARQHAPGALVRGGEARGAVRQADAEQHDEEPGGDQDDGGRHRPGLADRAAAEGRDGADREERAERRQAAGEGDVEPADRRAVPLRRRGDADPDQEREGEQWVAEAADRVRDRGERHAAGTERHEEQHLGHDPGDEADDHHPPRPDQVGQGAREVRPDEGSEAGAGDDRRDGGLGAAEGRDHVRHDEVRLDPDPRHEEQDGDEAEGERAGDAHLVQSTLGRSGGGRASGRGRPGGGGRGRSGAGRRRHGLVLRRSAGRPRDDEDGPTVQREYINAQCHVLLPFPS
ncbi:hypothetical protein Cus16_3004 [Curtobacterium sp. ER1/6]|nr:hypothetical protein Cus16_3004 [Curtobacterium sp. ER1/6]